jgi:hypothetical protein
MLPLALIIHLGFSTWMYGNNEFLKSNVLNISWILRQIGLEGNLITDMDELYAKLQDLVRHYDPLGLSARVWRLNVFPMFLFFALTLLTLLMSQFFGSLVLPVLDRTIGVVYRLVRFVTKTARDFILDHAHDAQPKQTKKEPNDEPKMTASPTTNTNDRKHHVSMEVEQSMVVAQYPDFTGPFEIMQQRQSKKVDKEKGYEVLETGVVIRRWQVDTAVRNKGEKMLTWEAMTAPVKTYAMSANPKYKVRRRE